MKKILSVILSIMMLQILVIPSYADGNVVTDAPSRVINLVFDNSESMVLTRMKRPDGTIYVNSIHERWSQAWYALEVFSGLMGENDVMNVFFLYNGTGQTGADLVIKGRDGAEVNVRNVHDYEMIFTGGTPFTRVQQAYHDLEAQSADEKWLVVLTDGVYNEVNNNPDSTLINDFYQAKKDNINIMTLEIGKDLQNNIRPDAKKGIYLETAAEGKQILEKVIDISTRIFNTDRLTVNAYTKTISFDVPMGELIVFAQGKNVQINGIKKSDGTAVSCESDSVEVKHNDTSVFEHVEYDGAKNSELVADTTLCGRIATFKGDFSSGDYELDVTGAETIEVYYKPNIDIAVYIKDANGNEVTNLAELEAGEYTMEFGFVKGGTKEVIPPSELLGDVKYEAKVTNNGNEHSRTYSSGDRIRLEKGDLSIEVVGRYLKYNSISTRLSYNIFMKNEVTFEVIEDPQYTMLKEGFESTPPIKVKAMVEGREITADEWQQMDVPVVSPGMSLTLGDFRAEKSETIGVYNIYPTMKGEKPSLYVQYGDSSYNIDYKGEVNGEEWSGKHDATVKIKEGRDFPDIYPDLFIVLLVIAGLIFLILLYTPLFKPRLPKRLKKAPKIYHMPETFGLPEDITSLGEYKKDLHSVLLPKKAETATIKYAPYTANAPILEIKAIRGKMFTVTNLESFKGNYNVLFDGEPIAEDATAYRSSGNFEITVQAPGTGYSYRCNPSED